MMRAIPKVFSLFITISFSVGALALDDEKRLEQEAISIDQVPFMSQNEQVRTDALAEQFGVSAVQIDSLRDHNMGWGEIIINLSLAKRAVALFPASLTTDQALVQIEQLRGKKLGWGQIAQHFGFRLEPVVSDTKRASEALQAADRRKSLEKLQRVNADRSGNL